MIIVCYAFSRAKSAVILSTAKCYSAYETNMSILHISVKVFISVPAFGTAKLSFSARDALLERHITIQTIFQALGFFLTCRFCSTIKIFNLIYGNPKPARNLFILDSSLTAFYNFLLLLLF